MFQTEALALLFSFFISFFNIHIGVRFLWTMEPETRISQTLAQLGVVLKFSPTGRG